MMPTHKGSFRLFQFAGITVFLHWSWFLVALFEFQNPAGRYRSLVWNAVEYLALFGIVLLHEFGHALACRSVGGRAEQIVLWPLGGVAYVNPPQRPGAMLSSIVAGPLVNVGIGVLLTGAILWGSTQGWWTKGNDVRMLLLSLWFINLAVLVFNLLPVYPLDGGKVVWSLLWFFLGRARSLMIAALIGMIGVAGVFLLAIGMRSVWLGIIAVFILLSCWRGLQAARFMKQLDRMPRHHGVVCPFCHEPPVRGEFSECQQCHTAFDPFETGGLCPQCATPLATVSCLNCGADNPLPNWVTSP